MAAREGFRPSVTIAHFLCLVFIIIWGVTSQFTGRQCTSLQGQVGIALTFVGLSLLLSFPSVDGGPTSWTADALVFATAFFWAVYTLLAEPVFAKALARWLTLVGFLAGTPLLFLPAIPELFKGLRHVTLASRGGIVFSGILAMGFSRRPSQAFHRKMGKRWYHG